MLLSKRNFLQGSVALTGLSALSPGASFAQQYGSVAQRILGETLAVNHTTEAFGNDIWEEKYWSDNDAATYQSNMRNTVIKYFNGSYVPNRYRNHYHNHWDNETYYRDDHTYYCSCCYLMLFELVRGTFLRAEFERLYQNKEKFPCHY